MFENIRKMIHDLDEALEVPLGKDEVVDGVYRELVSSGLHLLHVANFYRDSLLRRAK